MLKRTIQKHIEKFFFQNKLIIIHGARQVGKTTLVKELQKKYSADSFYLNCDEPDVRSSLANATSTEIKNLIGRKKVVFIDEAQRIINIGITMKLMVDQFPNVQIVATGSSSLYLSNEIVEPLTGRKYEFQLHPLSLAELKQKYSKIELDRILEKRIVMGMYPEIEEKQDVDHILLKNLSSSYLYKDVLQYQDIRRPELLEKLLVALALQIGQEVSYNRLSNSLGVNKQTISNYIDLLEKSFVIFRLTPFSRNLRNELTKLRKVYFYDTGIRNALINNINAFRLRQDVGQLWENFMISERRIQNDNNLNYVNSYFWRTHNRSEIDYIEEKGGRLSAFEFKWKPGRLRVPREFQSSYSDCPVKEISSKNYSEFIDMLNI